MSTPGSYEWAMAQVANGRRVRRARWPIQEIKAGTRLPGGDGGPDYIVPADRTLVWHLFPCDGQPIKGWGGNVGGDHWPGDFADADGSMDGGCYTATAADRAAVDWESVGVAS